MRALDFAHYSTQNAGNGISETQNSKLFVDFIIIGFMIWYEFVIKYKWVGKYYLEAFLNHYKMAFCAENTRE